MNNCPDERNSLFSDIQSLLPRVDSDSPRCEHCLVFQFNQNHDNEKDPFPSRCAAPQLLISW